MTEFHEIEDKKLNVIIDGVEKECDVLFTYDADGLDVTYVGYTDGTVDENGIPNIYTSKHSILDPGKLEAITDPEEIALMKDVVAQIIEQYK